ncbi:GtrA family protein [Helicobacter sp. 23-1044]
MKKYNFIVIVINDGSPSAFGCVFNALDSAIVLKNAVNLGKGAALKNGINYAINAFPNASCIITMDCDLQHSIKDVLNLRDKFLANNADFAIGVRSFSAESKTPFRSKFGNKLTALAFKILFGKHIKDTQSGLRAFNIPFAKNLLSLPQNGYEFEMQMLILAANSDVKILQISIKTIYIDNNASSHFNPIFDSLSIYCVLLRHIGNSLLTALIDYVVFVFCFVVGFSLLWAMICGRIVAGSFNFIVGKKFVFKSKGNMWVEMLSYVMLTIILMLISMKSIAIFSAHSGISEILVKPFCEAGIFAISFLVQRFFIFRLRAKFLD